MIIKNISFEKYNLKLAEPFTYFTAKLETLHYALIKIESQSGFVGFGEAGIAWDVTGETQEGALGLLKYIKPILIGKKFTNIQTIEKLMDELNLYIYDNSSLKAGIEMALLDLLGKYKKQPVWKLLGGKPLEFVTAQQVFTYNDLNSQEFNLELEHAFKDEAKIIKLKFGQDINKELAKVEELVRKYPKIKLVFDINQGWKDVKTALPIIKKLEKFHKNIAWIEQPIFHADFEGLSILKKKSKLKIMADESCHDLKDLKNLYFRKSVDLVNIKLAKTGGIFEALRMIEFCEKNKIKYMLGDMIHSQLGTAANLNLATLGNFASFDLTKPETIKNDPFSGLKVEHYRFFVPQQPGMGVKPRN
ncbi:MAG: L-Ala-D/L-Glu epimerase [Berkelbacteria bacterium GW2011_GWE1_39_12]|uniref:L-Ala-D/L-Glu epimerase n=1 Tax=Berkelbacteria bacterium GW2011_GWE1_39_12 TaxID=1618337 RepID=A0A0G4B510_9BACT|nr:MAG: L-Ala-D/L-Glu epimerase [Berkelbacteria bacterium GW2011_GWE1_39_12]